MPRSGSVGFIDTPLGMGPATTLMSPRRYINLGAAGAEEKFWNLYEDPLHLPEQQPYLCSNPARDTMHCGMKKKYGRMSVSS